MGGGERRSQSYSGEYYWLVPDLTQNKQGRYMSHPYITGSGLYVNPSRAQQL